MSLYISQALPVYNQVLFDGQMEIVGSWIRRGEGAHHRLCKISYGLSYVEYTCNTRMVTCIDIILNMMLWASIKIKVNADYW